MAFGVLVTAPGQDGIDVCVGRQLVRIGRGFLVYDDSNLSNALAAASCRVSGRCPHLGCV